MSYKSTVSSSSAARQIDASSARIASDIMRANVAENGDAPANTNTSYRISVGDTFNGNLNSAGDRDWVAINLTAGNTYVIDLMGSPSGAGTLSDPSLQLHDSNGNIVASNDDGGNGYESRLSFTAPTTSTFYLSAQAYNDNDSGTYTMAVEEAAAPGAPASVNELARYLSHGYWNDTGRAWRAFETSNDNRITADISGLTAAGKQLARWAMEAWEMVADIDFRIVNNGNADITFDDWDSGAYSTSNLSGHRIVNSFVNIGTDWLNAYGTTLDSYSFQTYIHELGHALGLGHQGSYNGNATYPNDATFVNDSWQMSIMSYFDQATNTAVNADYASLLTTMMADNVAMQSLYGRAGGSSPTAGNTIWGANTNLSGYMSHVADYLQGGNGNGNFTGGTPVALTIFDRGGRDTLNLSFSTSNDRVSLGAETFSNIDGLTGNLGIARGTVIENLIAGSGNDVIGANTAANNIRGGAGHDRISGLVGSDTLHGNGGNDALWGNGQNDLLVGGYGNDTLAGGYGADRLLGHAGSDTLRGDFGNDFLQGNGQNDLLIGGDGNDTLAGGYGADRLRGHAGSDRLWGGAGNDALSGNIGNDLMDGGGGSDRLWAGYGADTLNGGSGRDTLSGGAGFDQFNFTRGGGHDVITDFGQHDAEDINLSQIWAINNFRDLVQNHLRNVDDDVMIVYATGSILLEGVGRNEIGFGRAYDADDFIF